MNLTQQTKASINVDGRSDSDELSVLVLRIIDKQMNHGVRWLVISKKYCNVRDCPKILVGCCLKIIMV